LQFAVSGLYGVAGVSDVVARLVPAIFGIMTIIVVYFTGRMLYNSRVAFIAASVLALLPYHIIMTRQVMVDVPFSFFFVLTLFFMAKYVATNNRLWVYGVGASAGLSFLSKEVGILTLIVSLLYMLLTRKLGIKNLVLVISSFLLAVSPQLTLILTRLPC
jgi:4-amino-4-deoxy-L-arabinose transferase-like glycosyltransferase